MVTKRVTTVSLEGEVKEVVFDREYPYVEVANMGSAPVYLSKYEDISAGTDGVYTVSAGSSIVARMDSDTVYVSGSGVVQIAAKYEAEHSFKSASKGGDTPIADAYTKAETDMLLSGKFNTERVVDALPDNPETHTLYVLGNDAYVYLPTEEVAHDWTINTPIPREKVTRVEGNGGYITITKDGNNVTFAGFNADGSTYRSPRTVGYNNDNDTIKYNGAGTTYLYYANSDAFSCPDDWKPLRWIEKLSGGWHKIGISKVDACTCEELTSGDIDQMTTPGMYSFWGDSITNLPEGISSDHCELIVIDNGYGVSQKLVTESNKLYIRSQTGAGPGAFVWNGWTDVTDTQKIKTKLVDAVATDANGQGYLFEDSIGTPLAVYCTNLWHVTCTITHNNVYGGWGAYVYDFLSGAPYQGTLSFMVYYI